MSIRFLELPTAEDLDRALAASAARPILIFKHSPTCGASAMAYEEMMELLEGDPLPVDIYLLQVRAARQVAIEVERRLRVRHESPQVLLIDKGAVIWHTSHNGVSVASVRSSLGRLAR